MATPLEVTFRGPFVFRFGKDGMSAYLAHCEKHYLTVKTDTNDVPPADKTDTFSLTGPTPAAITRLGQTQPLLIVDWDWESKNWPTSPGKTLWRYVFELPAPDIIFGLCAEYADIQGHKAPTGTRFARGLRLKYGDSKPPDISGLNTQIDARHFDETLSIYSIEIDYRDYADPADPNTIKDPHADAR